jgi:hypothetical protein
MKQAITQWLEKALWREGFLAFSILHPDRTAFNRPRGHGFTPEALTVAAQTVGEIFQRLDRENLAYGRLAIVYKNALLHADRRADGSCFLVFTVRDARSYDAAGLNKMFVEFTEIKTPVDSQTH